MPNDTVTSSSKTAAFMLHAVLRRHNVTVCQRGFSGAGQASGCEEEPTHGVVFLQHLFPLPKSIDVKIFSDIWYACLEIAAI
jgi:hypothetical protein